MSAADRARDWPKLQRRTLVEDAHEAILRLILDGTLGPGEALVERRLADQLGTSRGPVREALLRLAEEGLLLDTRVRGTLAVREFTASDILDLYNVRVGIETVAVRLAARRRVSPARLKRLLRAMLVAGEHADVERFSELDLEFHRVLCRLAGNPYIDRIIDQLLTQLRVAFLTDNSYYVQRSDLVALAREHEPIIAAIAAGDEERAVEALIVHIEGFEAAAHTSAQLAIPPKRD